MDNASKPTILIKRSLLSFHWWIVIVPVRHPVLCWIRLTLLILILIVSIAVSSTADGSVVLIRVDQIIKAVVGKVVENVAQ